MVVEAAKTPARRNNMSSSELKEAIKRVEQMLKEEPERFMEGK